MLVTLRLHSDRDGSSSELYGYSLSQLRSSCEYMRSFLDFGVEVANLPWSEDEQSGDDVVHNLNTGSCSVTVAASVLHYLVKGPSEAPLVVDGSNAAELLSLADLWCLSDIKALVLGSLRRTLCNGFRRPVAGADTVTSVPQVAVLVRQALSYGIGDADGSLQRLYDNCVTWMAGWLARSWPNRTFAGLSRDIQEDVLRAAKQRVTADTAPAVLAACRQLSGMPSVAWAQRVQDMREELVTHTLSYIWSNFAEVCEQAGRRRDRTECWGPLLEELLTHVAANPDPEAAVRTLPRWAAATRTLQYGNGSDPEGLGDVQGWVGEEEELQLKELYEHLRSYCVRHLPLLTRSAAYRALPRAQQQHILQVAEAGVGGTAVPVPPTTPVGETTGSTEHAAASRTPLMSSEDAGGGRSGGGVAWVISGQGDKPGPAFSGTAATRTPPAARSATATTTMAAALSMSRRREIRPAWASSAVKEPVDKRDAARQGTGAGASGSCTSAAAAAAAVPAPATEASIPLAALASPDALAAAAALVAAAAAAALRATPGPTPAPSARTAAAAAAQAGVGRPTSEAPKASAASGAGAAARTPASPKFRLPEDSQPSRVASPRSSYLHEAIAAGFAAGRSASRRDAVLPRTKRVAPTGRPVRAEADTSSTRSTDSGSSAAGRHDAQGGKRPHVEIAPEMGKQTGHGHVRPKHFGNEAAASEAKAGGMEDQLQHGAGGPPVSHVGGLEGTPEVLVAQKQGTGQWQEAGSRPDEQQQPAVEKPPAPVTAVAAQQSDRSAESGLSHVLFPSPQPCVQNTGTSSSPADTIPRISEPTGETPQHMAPGSVNNTSSSNNSHSTCAVHQDTLGAPLLPPPPPPPPSPLPAAVPSVWDPVSAAAAAWTGAGLAVAEVRATVLLSVGTHPASAAAATAAAARSELIGQGYSQRLALSSAVGPGGALSGFLPPPAGCVHLPAGCTVEPIAVWHSVTVSPPEACSSQNTTAAAATMAGRGDGHEVGARNERGTMPHTGAADIPRSPGHAFDAGMWAAAAAAAAWGGASASGMSIPQWLGAVPAALPSSHPSHTSGHPGAGSGISSHCSGCGSAVCSSASGHPSFRLSEFESSIVNSSIYSGDRGYVAHAISSAASSPKSTTILPQPPLNEAALAAVAATAGTGMGDSLSAPPNSRTPSLHSVRVADDRILRHDSQAVPVDPLPVTPRSASLGARSCSPRHESQPLEAMASTVSVESLISAAASGAAAAARGRNAMQTRGESQTAGITSANRAGNVMRESGAVPSRVSSDASAHMLNGPSGQVQQPMSMNATRRLIEPESKHPPKPRHSAAASGFHAGHALPVERYVRAAASNGAVHAPRKVSGASSVGSSSSRPGSIGPLMGPLAPSAAVAAVVNRQPLSHGRVTSSSKSIIHNAIAHRSPSGAATAASPAAGAVAASSKVLLHHDRHLQQQSSWAGSGVVEGSTARSPAAFVGRPGSALGAAKPGIQRSVSAHRGYMARAADGEGSATGSVAKPRRMVAWR